MNDVISWLQVAWQQTSGWELIAVFFAILYLVLAMRQNIWCWGAALVSTGIYVFLFFDVNLYMESALQLYYIAMAIYGWYAWRHHTNTKEDLHVSTWSKKQHIMAISGILIVTSLSAWLLKNTGADYPWLDSFTTWSAVLTTWMVARKILENWLYWIVIDAVSIYLYLNKELYVTALLFALYIILCVSGYQLWKKSYRDTVNFEPKTLS
jgi:nicotinamide mononucleotide transporter